MLAVLSCHCRRTQLRHLNVSLLSSSRLQRSSVAPLVAWYRGRSGSFLRREIAFLSTSSVMNAPKQSKHDSGAEQRACNLVINPPPTVVRLPAAPQAADAVESFARSLSWEQFKPQFLTTLPQLGIRVPAKDAGKVVKLQELKDVVLAAARVKPIVQDSVSKGSFRIIRLRVTTEDELPASVRIFIAKHDDWTLVPAEVQVEHDYFSTETIIKALLPLPLVDGAPSAFTMVGHIAHINLRDEYLPYKYIIGEVLLQSSATVRTVVNKLDSIDAEFRFFEMEKLAGEDDFVAEISESNCIFTFDFRSVYWNSRLHTEHARLVNSFKPYDVIVDVMAGVGPFAIPAGKRGCWVYANDLNPSSADSLRQNRKRNKVEDRVRAADCVDGREFIRNAPARIWKDACEGGWANLNADDAWAAETKVRKLEAKEALHARLAEKKGMDNTHFSMPPSRSDADMNLSNSLRQRRSPRRLPDHFVMNLPASALEFLDAFRGAYAELLHDVGKEEILQEVKRRQNSQDPNEGQPWPMVHVHCFTKEVDHAHEDICERANRSLGLEGSSQLIPPPMAGQESIKSPTPDVSLHFVRAVAPNKDMYCLSFRLTPEILFPTTGT